LKSIIYFIQPLCRCCKAYEDQLANAKMMVSMAGAMTTAEIGKISERQDKVHIISCTGAN
jgi:deoxyhypusine synthase